MSDVRFDLIEIGEVSVETRGAPFKSLEENGEVGCIQKRELTDPCE